MPLTLLSRHNPLASPAEQFRILEHTRVCAPFEARLSQTCLNPLRAQASRSFKSMSESSAIRPAATATWMQDRIAARSCHARRPKCVSKH